MAGLGSLVPLLQEEPRGRRRELLSCCVQQWMERGEAVKEALRLQEEVLQEGGQEGDKQASCVLM